MAKANKKNTTYLDLDAVSPEREIVVKFAGKDHQLVPASLDDFINNTRELQKLSTTAVDPQKEIEIVCDMLLRSFPSMTREDLGKLRLDQLNALVAFAQKHNGADEVETEAQKENAENPPPAG